MSVGSFLIFRPTSNVPPAVPAILATTVKSQNLAPQLPLSRVDEVRASNFRLVISKGNIVSGSALLTAREGQSITLEIVSDTPDMFHLHGYDLKAQLNKNKVETLRFVANRSGRFEFELHHVRSELGALEVEPRN